MAHTLAALPVKTLHKHTQYAGRLKGGSATEADGCHSPLVALDCEEMRILTEVEGGKGQAVNPFRGTTSHQVSSRRGVVSSFGRDVLLQSAVSDKCSQADCRRSKAHLHDSLGPNGCPDFCQSPHIFRVALLKLPPSQISTQ